jgi:poly(A) polymerase
MPNNLPDWATRPLVKRIFAAARACGGEARIVGGAVRDWLVGAPVHDIDMAVNLPIGDVAAHLVAEGIKTVETGIAFGTVTVVDRGDKVELTQTRVDLETDGRHAVVAHNADWAADARRRDFTVNAMYLDESGQIFDPLGGVADLRASCLRFAGDAAQRVQEDALRMLRYCRFLPRFSHGGIDPDARAALQAHAALCQHLSGERVAQELRQIMTAPSLSTVITLMHETALDQHALGVGLNVAPAIAAATLDQTVIATVGWTALLAAVMPVGAAETLALRLRLGRREAAELARLDAGLDKTALAGLNGPSWQKTAYWCQAYMAALYVVQSLRNGIAPDGDRLDKLVSWEPPRYPLRGADLLSHGVDNGPGLGQMLSDAEARWVASGFRLEKAALLSWLIGD